MPELPEVETTLRGIAPHLCGTSVVSVTVRNGNLRWPVPVDLPFFLTGGQIFSVSRRAKYLLIAVAQGHLMIHLGMSGSLQIVDASKPVEKHDHVDVALSSGKLLRFTDPRRFGSVLWVTGDVFEHKLLAQLGPEPFDEQVDGRYFYCSSRGRKISVKQFVMDNRVVVGVGNIYANEALFRSRIHPARAAGRISLVRYQLLAKTIKEVLAEAIKRGGTTLKDFTNGEGKPGYFQQQLDVYGRAGLPCVSCGEKLKEIRQGQRSTVFCSGCQK